jgi:hypothetical protein
MGYNIQDYDEFENRYEGAELRFIANYIISNLCFLKTELQITDNRVLTHCLHVFWNTLDLFNKSSTRRVEDAMPQMFETLKDGLMALLQLEYIDRVML